MSPAAPDLAYPRTWGLYDRVYAAKDYAREAGRLVRFLPPRLRRPGTTWLDVACGTGRHLDLLRRRGFVVAGIDANPGMVRLARKRLGEGAVARGDMRSFDLGRRFDVVSCLFSSVGYVRTLAGLRRAVGAMARHLEPGGVLLVEAWFSRDQIRRGHVGLTVVEDASGKIARMNVVRLAGRDSVLDMHHLVGSARGVRHVLERHVLGLFSDAELLAAARRAGLRARLDRRGVSGRRLLVATAPSAAGGPPG